MITYFKYIISLYVIKQHNLHSWNFSFLGSFLLNFSTPKQKSVTWKVLVLWSFWIMKCHASVKQCSRWSAKTQQMHTGLRSQGEKWNFLSLLYARNLTFHWLFSTNPVEDRAKCHTYPTFGSICMRFGYPLQDWWRTVNEMSNFLHTGEIGDFIFCPVVYASQLSVHLMCLQGSCLNMWPACANIKAQ